MDLWLPKTIDMVAELRARSHLHFLIWLNLTLIRVFFPTHPWCKLFGLV